MSSRPSRLRPQESMHLALRPSRAFQLQCLLGLAMLGLGLWPTQTSAQQLRPAGLGARVAGLGDAGRSSALGHDALYLNPAAMAQAMLYELHLGYTYDGFPGAHSPAATIVDSATNPMLTIGVGYAFLHAEGLDEAFGAPFSNERQAHQVRAAFASGYRGDMVSIHAGVGMRWQDVAVGGGPKDSGWGIDAGVLISLADLLRIGIVGHNLLKNDSFLDMPRSLGSGISLVYQSFLVAFDAVVDFDTAENTRASYHAGVQYVALDMIPIRLGFVADRITERNRITGGLGFWTPAFSLDIGYQHNIKEASDFLVGVDIKIYLP